MIKLPDVDAAIDSFTQSAFRIRDERDAARDRLLRADTELNTLRTRLAATEAELARAREALNTLQTAINVLGVNRYAGRQLRDKSVAHVLQADARARAVLKEGPSHD